MRPQELNLLVIFDTIMTEKSITRAAERLSMTQPAVSNAVARMRANWKDDLFVKDGRNIQPTSYATNLWDQIRTPLHNLNEAIAPGTFDPKTAKRTFRVAVADIVVDWVWLEMRQLFEKEAPGINLHAVPYTIVNTEKVLEDADVDLVVSATTPMNGRILSSHLFDSSNLCVMRKDHPLAKPNLSIEEFAAADHLLVSLSGDSSGPTDQALQLLGMSRRVAMTVNHFASAAPMIMDSDLIALLPFGAIEKHIANGKLSITKPPIDIPVTAVSLLWHKRQDNDAGLKWLRHHLKRITVNHKTRNESEVRRLICK